MIVDSHVHLYSEKVSQDPKTWGTQREETYWLSCVAPASGKSLQSWKTVDQLLHDMDSAGIDHAIIVAWYWENHDSCVENVSWQKEWIAGHPDRLSALAPFNAKGGSQAIELLKAAFDSGFKGIGELNPPAQGYSYDDPILSEAIDLASQYDGAVNFHVTDPCTHDYPGKIDTPYRELLQVADAHPNCRFVFAHLGGCEPLRSDLASRDNIYFDTAACPLLYKKPLYRKFCDTVGSDKLLFGSDYPLRVFPRDKNAPDFLAPLTELRDSQLTAEELKPITGVNARTLFKLS